MQDKFTELQQEMTLKRDLDDIDSMFSGLNLTGNIVSDNTSTPKQTGSDILRVSDSQGPRANVDVMKDLASIFGGKKSQRTHQPTDAFELSFDNLNINDTANKDTVIDEPSQRDTKSFPMTLTGDKNKISENTNSAAVLEQSESNCSKKVDSIGENKSVESTTRTIKVDRGPQTKKQESDGEE